MHRALVATIAALAALSLALPATALLGEPSVVTGSGTATFRNVLAHITCPGMVFHIQVAGTTTALVTLQAIHPTEIGCTTASYDYSLNPSLVEGNWQEGWEGDAIGADPPVVWPIWEVRIGPATDPDNVSFWSYYVDENGREYYLEGFFAIDQTL
ncbi:MAG TPA: hypothetical protein VGR28_03860 [Candidatus Thermoplasmatota archaeon]|jgi:hypothetical protein|nr:hypothetical protein [Candidatus Thermoplasmatota archaeon]